MSKLTVSTIAFLFISSITASAKANEIAPVDLVFSAYQGYFTQSGIPSGDRFLQQARLGQIDVEALANSAVENNKLSTDTATSESYLKKIDAALFKILRTR